MYAKGVEAGLYSVDPFDQFVGLLFAGSDEVTIANRREDVMAALGGIELL